MRIHFLQHVPFEDPAYLHEWVKNHAHEATFTMLCNDQALPALDAFDWLVVLGGPMSIYDEDEFPWLRKEKILIRKAIDEGKMVLGICLGAQLLAEALGADVYRNSESEIGWHEVTLSPDGANVDLFTGLPNSFEAFHWHHYTFDIPEGAVPCASSEASTNQAFVWGDRVIGIQFHLEFSPQIIQRLVKNCHHELQDGPYVQSVKEITQTDKVPAMNRLMEQVLNNIIKLRSPT